MKKVIYFLAIFFAISFAGAVNAANGTISGTVIGQSSIACNIDSDCGAAGYHGSPYCQDNDVRRDYWVWYCDNPGTPASTCTSEVTNNLQASCTANQTCSNGSCANNPAITCSTNSQCGTNGIVGGPFCKGNNVYKHLTAWACSNAGTTASSCASAVTDQLLTTCAANQTCTNGSCSTNPAIACSTNSQCGTDGFTGVLSCQGNGVYQDYTTYTCNNSGLAASFCTHATATRLKTACTANQSCSGGSCMPISCNSNSDCGINGITGSSFCQGNSVYQNYINYTCNNPGTAASACVNSTAGQLQTTCGANQTCSAGTCNNPINTCTPNYQQSCLGNSLYWYDSCGTQQGFIQTCPNGCSNNACQGYINNCSYHSYQKCAGNNLYWFDSCGTQQDLIQYCTNGCSNNSCQYYNNNNNYGALTVAKTVRNLTSGSGFSTSTYASPGDMLMFMVTIQASGSDSVRNVFVKDILPANLIYSNQLVIACAGGNNGYNNCSNNYNNQGNMISGINLNTIYPDQTVTITYQAQVAPAQNFAFGTTTMNNNVSVTSSSLGYIPGSSAAVVVTKATVLGASTVSTGLTNNFWVDSFFLPLLLTLIGLWMWKAGMFFGIEKWFDNKKKIKRGYNAEKELSKRIANIQKLGKV